MRVKPAVPGSVIRDPRTKIPLPDEGVRVDDSPYWQRRLRSGDVVLVEEREERGPTPPHLAPVAPLTTRSPSGRRGEE